jgi:hypothetical protein
MQLYVVTGRATEEDRYGVILAVRTRVYGVYSSRARADAMAAKYDGHVYPFYLDQDGNPQVVEEWENPGFASSS